MTLLILGLLLGIIVGVVSSLFGIGGGVFIVPLLPLLTGASAHEAVATSLVSVFFVTLMNTWSFSRQGEVNWRTGWSLGTPAGVLALVSGQIAVQMDEKWLELFFLLVLILLLAITFYRRRLYEQVLTDPTPPSWARPVGMAIAVVAGFISSFTGIGAGIILSPTMFNLRLVRPKELVPTTNLTTMLTTLSGGLSYFWVGASSGRSLIDFKMAIGIFVVATITGFFVRPFQAKMSGQSKAIAMCAILLMILIKQTLRWFEIW